MLAHHPDARQRLQAEVDTLRNHDLDRAALEQCPYLECVLREALRYFTPAPLFFRNVQRTRPIAFAGHTVPADTLIMITNWLLHRDPNYYHDPDRFNPERWQEANGLVQRTPFGSAYFFPLGRGPRTCVGQPFALLFLKLALVVLLGRVRVELDLTLPYQPTYFFGVMMPKELPVRFVASSEHRNQATPQPSGGDHQRV